MTRRRRKRGHSSGSRSRRSVLCLAAGALGIGGVYGSQAFSGTALRRPLGISVSNDSRSLLAIESEDPIVGTGERTTLVRLTNNFEETLDDISVEIENTASSELDVAEFTTPNPLEPDESGAVRASITADSSVTETVRVAIRASSDRESVVVSRDLTVSYEPESDSGLAVRVDDLTSMDTDRPAFYVSYDTHGRTGNVRITASDRHPYGASDSATVLGERGGALLRPGWNAGAAFEITVRVIDDGTVIEERTIVTTADTQNPSDNDDLRRGASASLRTATIVDETSPARDAVRFDFSYEVSSTGSFSEVGLYIRSTDETGGVGDRTRDDRSGDSVSVSTDNGANTEYKLAILVFDANGAVVESRVGFDNADGQGRTAHLEHE